MQVHEWLKPVVELHETQLRLSAAFSGMTLQLKEANVLVLCSPTTLGDRFVRYVEEWHRQPFLTRKIVLRNFGESFPALASVPFAISSLWFLISPDRYEFQSKSFLEWADANREMLAGLPFYGFQVFEPGQLEDWREPILVEHERVPERDLLVIPLALDRIDETISHLSPSTALQRSLIAMLLLRGLRRGVSPNSWDQTIREWDETVANALDHRVARLKSIPGDRAAKYKRAFHWFQQLTDLNTLAKISATCIEGAIGSAQALDNPHGGPQDIENLAREIAGYLNERRRSGPLPADQQPVPIEAFASEFQRYRGRLLHFLDYLIEKFAGSPGLEEKRQTYLAREEQLFKQIQADLAQDIKMILLGPYSSGKSTLINSLLGLSNEADQLPTGAKPLTATINILEYADEEAIDIEFLDEVTLVLFQRCVEQWTAGRWKVNTQGIAALLRWIEEGSINPTGFFVEKLQRSGKFRETDHTGFTRDDLQFLITIREKNIGFCDEQLLKQHEAVLKISKLTFTDRPLLPPRTDFAATFEVLNRPETGLRIKEVHLKRKREELKGLRFVDTPGTDSMMSHHDMMARQYIERSSESPVIYLFDGNNAGSQADVENLVSLRDLKISSDRIFIVINKKRMVEGPDQEQEVLNVVLDRLRGHNMTCKRTYFIDAKDAPNNPNEKEWQELGQDLRSYVNRNRTKLLRESADSRIQRHLEQLLASNLEHIQDLSGNKEKLHQKAAQLIQVATKIGELIESFKKDEVQAAKRRIFQSPYASDFNSDIEYLLEQFRFFDCRAFRTPKKDLKLQAIHNLLEPLKGWKAQLRQNMESVNDRFHAFLEIELRRRAGQLNPCVDKKHLPKNFSPLELAEIETVAREDVNYSVWSYTGWIENKVAKLSRLIVLEAKRVAVRIEEQFKTIVDSYESQCLALKAQADLFASNMVNDEKTDVAKMAQTKLDIQFLEKILKEFAAIG